MRLKVWLAVLAAVLVGAIALPAVAGAALPVPYGNAALADFAFHEVSAPTTVAGANTNCSPSPSHPYPVVLVHGTAEDEGSNWVSLAPLLANDGYCVYAFNDGETNLSLSGRVDGLNYIQRSAQELSEFIDSVLSKTGAPKVDIVGHSQGGIMPNYYLKFLDGASKVNLLLGLAPSNHGTTVDGRRSDDTARTDPWLVAARRPAGARRGSLDPPAARRLGVQDAPVQRRRHRRRAAVRRDRDHSR